MHHRTLFNTLDQGKCLKEIREKEAKADELRKKIKQMNPELDLVDYQTYSIIVENLENDEEENDDDDS